MPRAMEASRPTWTLRRKAEEKADYVGKRLRVEVLEAATTVSEPLPVEPLVEVDLWKQRAFRFVPPARVVSRSQSLRGPDEVQFAFHPTLTRLWSLKGRRSQRLIEAPGDNRKAYGFGLVDWRDGWFDGRIAPDGPLMPFASRCAQQWPVRKSVGGWRLLLQTISKPTQRRALSSCASRAHRTR